MSKLIRGTFAPLEAPLPKVLVIALITPSNNVVARGEAAHDGRLEIADEHDLRDEMKLQGVETVSLALDPGDRTLTILQGLEGSFSWPVEELPLLDLTLPLSESLRGKPLVAPPIGAPGQFDTVVAKLTTLAAASTPLALNARGDEVQTLQRKLRDLGQHVPQHELDQNVFGAGTRDALATFQARQKLTPTGTFDGVTQIALRNATH